MRIGVALFRLINKLRREDQTNPSVRRAIVGIRQAVGELARMEYENDEEETVPEKSKQGIQKRTEEQGR